MRKVAVVVGLFALTALVPVVGAGGRSATANADTSAITFGVPRIVDPIHAYGEPDIKVAPNGDVLVSGPQGTGVQRSIWNVSKDNGDSWRVVNGVPVASSQPVCQLAPAVCLDISKSSVGPGGGDTDIVVSRDNKIFFNDLWALQCFTAATSTDSGATVQSNPVGCSHPPADRQWMALFDPPGPSSSPYKGSKPLLYLAYNNILTGGNLDMSTDGLTFSPAISGSGAFGDTSEFPYADGSLTVDQATGDVLAVVGHNPADGKSNGVALAIGEPNADGSGQVTFHYNTITDGIQGSVGILFPVMAEDAGRNVYAMWGVDTGGDMSKPQAYHVFYSAASAADGWKTWTPPRQLDSPPSQSAVMPAIAAGGPGIIDAAWYGTDQRVDPSSHSNQPWDVYLAQVDHAETGSPHIVQTKVTPHPMHYDDICLLGTGCIEKTGNRNLADFFQVTIDHDGRARVVYDDTSNGLIQPAFQPLPGFNGTVDHSGGALVTVATQQTGLNGLTGQPLAAHEDTAPIGGVTDPAGDALFKPLGGTNVPGGDITDVELSMDSSTLHAKITVAGDGLGSAATAGGGTAAEAVVRWQLGKVLYYAAVEEPVGGGTPTYYAGPVQSVDLCSVSACDPHYFVYPAPPAGGTAVTGSKSGSGPTTYQIDVPVSAIGNATIDSLLEEVTGFVTVSPTPAAVPITNVQAFAEVVPVQIEGTRTFNFRASTVGPATPAPEPAPNNVLPRTGSSDGGLWAAAGMVLLGLALGARKLRHLGR